MRESAEAVGLLLASLLALLLTASVWFSEYGAMLGLATLLLAVVVGTGARGVRLWTAVAAFVVSSLAILGYPFFRWACSDWLSCV